MNIKLKQIAALTLTALFLPTGSLADGAQANNTSDGAAIAQSTNQVKGLSPAVQAILNSIDGDLTPAQQQVIQNWVNNNLVTNAAVPGVLANFQTMLKGLNNNSTLAITIFENNENSASLGTILSATPAQYTAAQAIAQNPLLTSSQQQQVMSWVTEARVNPNLTDILQSYQSALTSMGKLPAALQSAAPQFISLLFNTANNAASGSVSPVSIQQLAANLKMLVTPLPAVTTSDQPPISLALIMRTIETSLPSSVENNVPLLQQGIVNYIQANIASPNLTAILSSYNEAVNTIAKQAPPRGVTVGQWTAIQQQELTALNNNPTIAQNTSAFSSYSSAALVLNTLVSSLGQNTVAVLQKNLLSLLQSTNANDTNLTNYVATLNDLPGILVDIQTKIPSTLLTPAQVASWQDSIVNYIVQNRSNTSLMTRLPTWAPNFESFFKTLSSYQTQLPSLAAPVSRLWTTALQQMMTFVQQNPQNITAIGPASGQVLTAINNIQINVAEKYPEQAAALQTALLTLINNNLTNSNLTTLIQDYGSAFDNHQIEGLLNQSITLLPTDSDATDTVQATWPSMVGSLLNLIAENPTNASALMLAMRALPDALNAAVNAMQDIAAQYNLTPQQTSALQQSILTYLQNNPSDSNLAAEVTTYTTAINNIGGLLKGARLDLNSVTQAQWMTETQQIISTITTQPLDAAIFSGNLPEIENVFKTIDTLSILQPALPSSDMTAIITQINSYITQNSSNTGVANGTQIKALNAALSNFANLYQKTLSSDQEPASGQSWTSILASLLPSVYTNIANATDTVNAIQALPAVFQSINAGSLPVSLQQTLSTDIITYLKNTASTYGQNSLSSSMPLPTLSSLIENYGNAVKALNSLDLSTSGITTAQVAGWLGSNPENATMIISAVKQVITMQQSIDGLDTIGINATQITELKKSLINSFNTSAGSPALETQMTALQTTITALTNLPNAAGVAALQTASNNTALPEIINAMMTALSSNPNNAASINAGMSSVVSTLNNLYQLSAANNQSSNTKGALFLPVDLVSSVVNLIKNNASNSDIAGVLSTYNANLQQFNTLIANNPIITTSQAQQVWGRMVAGQNTVSLSHFFNTLSSALSSINQLSDVQAKTTLTQDFFSYEGSVQSNVAFNGLLDNFSTMLSTVASNQANPGVLNSFQILIPALIANPNLSLASSTALKTFLSKQANNPALPDMVTQIANNLGTLTGFQINSMNTYIANHPAATGTQTLASVQQFSFPNLMKLISIPIISLPSSTLSGDAATQALQLYNQANQVELGALNTSILPALLTPAQAANVQSYLAANPSQIQSVYHAIIAAYVANQSGPNTITLSGQTLGSMQDINSMVSDLASTGIETVGDLNNLVGILNNPALGLPANFASNLQTVSQAVASNAGGVNAPLTFPYSASQQMSTMIDTMALASPQQLTTILTSIPGVPASLNKVISTLVSQNLIPASQMSTFMSALTLYGQLQSAKSSGDYTAVNAALEKNPEQNAALLSFLSKQGAVYNAYTQGTSLQAQYQQAESAARGLDTQNFWSNTLNSQENPFNVIVPDVRGGDQGGFYTNATVNFDAAYYYYLASGNYDNTTLTAAQQATLDTNAQSFAQAKAGIMSSCGSGIKGFDCRLREDFTSLGSAIKGMFSGNSVGDIFRDIGEGLAAVTTFGTYDMLAGSMLALTVIPGAEYELINAGLQSNAHLGDVSAVFNDIASANPALGLVQLIQSYTDTCQDGPNDNCLATMGKNMTVGLADAFAAPFNPHSHESVTQRIIGSINDIVQVVSTVYFGFKGGEVPPAQALASAVDKGTSIDLSSVTDSAALEDAQTKLGTMQTQVETLLKKVQGNPGPDGKLGGNPVDVKTLQDSLAKLKAYEDQLDIIQEAITPEKPSSGDIINSTKAEVNSIEENLQKAYFNTKANTGFSKETLDNLLPAFMKKYPHLTEEQITKLLNRWLRSDNPNRAKLVTELNASPTDPALLAEAISSLRSPKVSFSDNPETLEGSDMDARLPISQLEVPDNISDALSGTSDKITSLETEIAKTKAELQTTLELKSEYLKNKPNTSSAQNPYAGLAQSLEGRLNTVNMTLNATKVRQAYLQDLAKMEPEVLEEWRGLNQKIETYIQTNGEASIETLTNDQAAQAALGPDYPQWKSINNQINSELQSTAQYSKNPGAISSSGAATDATAASTSPKTPASGSPVDKSSTKVGSDTAASVASSVAPLPLSSPITPHRHGTISIPAGTPSSSQQQNLNRNAGQINNSNISLDNNPGSNQENNLVVPEENNYP